MFMVCCTSHCYQTTLPEFKFIRPLVRDLRAHGWHVVSFQNSSHPFPAFLTTADETAGSLTQISGSKTPFDIAAHLALASLWLATLS